MKRSLYGWMAGAMLCLAAPSLLLAEPRQAEDASSSLEELDFFTEDTATASRFGCDASSVACLDEAVVAEASPRSHDSAVTITSGIPEPRLFSTEREQREIEFDVFVCGFRDSGDATIDVREVVDYLNSDRGASGYWSEVSHDALAVSFNAHAFYRIDKPTSDYRSPVVNVSEQVRKDCVEDHPETNGEFIKNAFIVIDQSMSTAEGGAMLDLLRTVVISRDMFVGHVISHEIGHTLHLPHSRVQGFPECEHCNFWDIMSGSRCEKSSGKFGCSGQHPLAYWKYGSDFLPDSAVESVAPGGRLDVRLFANAVPEPDALRLVLIEIADGSFYTVEYRVRIGSDEHIVDDGVIVHGLSARGARPTLMIDPSGRPSSTEAMKPGDSLYVRESDVEIHVIEVSDESALIQVVNDPELPPQETQTPVAPTAVFIPLILNSEAAAGSVTITSEPTVFPTTDWSHYANACHSSATLGRVCKTDSSEHGSARSVTSGWRGWARRRGSAPLSTQPRQPRRQRAC